MVCNIFLSQHSSEQSLSEWGFLPQHDSWRNASAFSSECCTSVFRSKRSRWWRRSRPSSARWKSCWRSRGTSCRPRRRSSSCVESFERWTVWKHLKMRLIFVSLYLCVLSFSFIFLSLSSFYLLHSCCLWVFVWEKEKECSLKDLTSV